MILQTQSTSYDHSIDGSFWFDFTNILLNIVIPILLLIVIAFTIFKFYKLLKDISASLKDISETYKNKNDRGKD
jgi:K+-transporting ATPase A subunit